MSGRTSFPGRCIRLASYERPLAWHLRLPTLSCATPQGYLPPLKESLVFLIDARNSMLDEAGVSDLEVGHLPVSMSTSVSATAGSPSANSLHDRGMNQLTAGWRSR